MTDDEIRKARDEHMRLRYEMKFDRSVWSRSMVRKFSTDMRKSFPQYWDYATSYSVTFKFRNERIKGIMVPMLKIATNPWHDEFKKTQATSVNRNVKIEKTLPNIKLYKK